MRKTFKDLSMGAKFHTGKSFGSGANSNVEYWLEFEKNSKSTAICVNQIGFGNTRKIGKNQKFSSNDSVWEI